MNATMRLVSARVRVLAAALLLSATAAGQPQKPHAEVPLGQSLHGPAKDAYTAGTVLFEQGDFAGAATKYQQAYDLSREPLLLFNMAACAKNMHAYARMQALLVRYEREAGAHVTPQDKAAVEEALSAVKDMVGSVAVHANVAGAAVTIDGEPAGTTPLAAPVVVDLGKHRVGVHKEGFDDVEQSIEIAGGSTNVREVSVVLQVRSAQLIVVAEPGSTVVVDGRMTARDRFDGRVTVGPHEIEVSAPGKTAYKAGVDLHDRETRTLQVTLRPEGRGAVWPWVVGGAVLAAGATVGAYFLLKPGDQVAPPPSGDLGSIHLAGFGR